MKTHTPPQRPPARAPQTLPTTPPATPTRTPAAHGLEARLAAASRRMDGRLAEAAVAYEVNTSHIPIDPLDLADVITGPLDTPPAGPRPTPLPDLHPTPVAGVLQRAHTRLLTGGWCKDTLIDADGARCMLGAIRAEARGDRGLEAGAVTVLMDAVRRKFGDVDSVPGFNDAWANGRVPVQMVGEAANLAHARSL
ncbi:hypothetical protein [Streptomyces sp. 039-1]|uniref:DUF6197 family protein n=1 Tax=Streptomyces sp. 039-1 TaxID=2789263 RepID=UPI0039F53F54